MTLKIGVTGHRTLTDSRRKELSAQVAEVISDSLDFFIERARIRNEGQEVHLEAFTCLAKGTDSLFAEEVLRRENRTLTVFLPFTKAAYASDFVGKEKDTLDRLLSYADRIESAVKTIPVSQEEREHAYLAAGKKLVDESDILLAVWDRLPAQGTGGTAEIVAYAEKMGREVHVIGVRDLSDDAQGKATDKFEKLDADANKKRAAFGRQWKGGIGAALLGVGCFAASVSFDFISKSASWSVAAAVSEVLFLGLAYFLLDVKVKKAKAMLWTARKKAEDMRVDLAFISAGFAVGAGTDKTSHIDSDNIARILYSLANRQISYHQVYRIDKSNSIKKSYRQILHILKYAFIILVLIHLAAALFVAITCHHSKPFHYFEEGLLFCCLIIPPLFASVEGIKYFYELEKKIQTSGALINILQGVKKELLLENDIAGLLQKAETIKSALQGENSEWGDRLMTIHIEYRP